MLGNSCYLIKASFFQLAKKTLPKLPKLCGIFAFAARILALSFSLQNLCGFFMCVCVWCHQLSSLSSMSLRDPTVCRVLPREEPPKRERRGKDADDVGRGGGGRGKGRRRRTSGGFQGEKWSENVALGRPSVIFLSSIKKILFCCKKEGFLAINKTHTD